MKLLIIAVCAFFVGLSAEVLGAPKEPSIVSDKPGQNSCPNQEPPCYDRHIVVKNPTKKKIKVWFDCGPEMMVVAGGSVRAGSKATFVIKTDTHITTGQCTILYLTKGRK